MKFTATVSALTTAFKSVLKVITRKPVHAVLANVHLECAGNSTTMTATNLETFIKVNVPTTVESEGAVLVPAKFTSDMVKILPAGQLEVTTDNDGDLISFSSDRCYRTIAATNPDQFPAIPEINPDDVFSIVVDSSEFIRKFKLMSQYVSKDSTRNITGVHLANGKLWASDGHRIAYMDLTYVGDNPSVIFHPTLVNFLSEICPVSKLISLDFTSELVRICTDKGELIQRLIEGQNMANFTGPNNSDSEIEVNRLDLINRIDLARITNEGDNVTLAVDKDGSAIEIETNMSWDIVPLEYQISSAANNFTLVNSQLILTLLKGIQSTTVKLRLSHSNIVTVSPGEYDLVDLLQLNFGTLDATKQALGVKAGSWEALVKKIKKDPALTSHLKGLEVYMGVMPIACIRDGRVIHNGRGFIPAIDLPYQYNNDGCLTVTRDESKYGFTTAEPLPYQYNNDGCLTVTRDESEYGFTTAEPLPVPRSVSQRRTRPCRAQSYSASAIVATKIQDGTWFDLQPINILKAAMAGDTTALEPALKKEYKTVGLFKTKLGISVRTWKQACDVYVAYVQKYKEAVTNSIAQHEAMRAKPEAQSLPSGVVTVDELKNKYIKLATAKTELGIKAVSWQVLADKINAQNMPITTTGASVESVVHQLKTKYIKLATAKTELGIKASSWEKLAEKVMAA